MCKLTLIVLHVFKLTSFLVVYDNFDQCNKVIRTSHYSSCMLRDFCTLAVSLWYKSSLCQSNTSILFQIQLVPTTLFYLSTL